MPNTRDHALNLIYETVDSLNRQLPPAQRLPRTPATVIVGPGASLDSLGIVNFLLALEERATDEFNRPVQLLDHDRLAAEDGPFRTIDTLATHLAELAVQ